MKNRRIITALLCTLLCAAVLAGCGRSLIITTGFGRGDVFRIGSESCKISEVRVYLLDLQKENERLFENALWESESSQELQEAVKDKFRKFADDILNYFTSLAEVGRESRLTIETNGIELPSQVEDIVDLWLQRNCVNGSFSIDEVDEKALRASQAMMPLFNANGRGMDARNFYRPLVQELKTKLPGYTVTQKTSSKTSQSDGGGTLGDAYILISQ